MTAALVSIYIVGAFFGFGYSFLTLSARARVVWVFTLFWFAVLGMQTWYGVKDVYKHRRDLNHSDLR